MRRLELFINDILIPLETQKDLGLRVNTLVSDASNIDARGGTFTYTIKIPWTIQLGKALGGGFDLQRIDVFNKGYNHRAEIFIDSERELAGLFRIRSQDNDYVQGEIYSDDIAWAQQISGKSLQEITSFPDVEFVPFEEKGFNFYITQMRDNPGAYPITFALNAYGVFPNPSSTDETVDNIVYPFYFDDFVPSFHYLTIVRKIFEDIGWNAKGKIFQETRIKNLIMPYIGDDIFLWNWSQLAWAKWVRATNTITKANEAVELTVDSYYATYRVLAKTDIIITLTYIAGATSASSLIATLYDADESEIKAIYQYDPPANTTGITIEKSYINPTISYTDSYGGETSYVDIVLRAYNSSHVLTPITGRVYVRVYGTDNSSTFDYLQYVDFNNESEVVFRYGERIQETRYNEFGQQTYNYQASFDPVDTPVSDVLVKQIIIPAEDLDVGDVIKINEQIGIDIQSWVGAVLDIKPDTSDYLPIAANLPDIDQKEFIKTFMIQFNLFVDANPDTKTITFYSQGDFYKELDFVVDLDNVTDALKATQEAITILKRIYFLYTKDTDDYLTASNQDTYNYTVKSDLLQASGESTVQSLFSPSGSKDFIVNGLNRTGSEITQTVPLVVISDQDGLETYNKDVIWRYNYVPRLLEWKGIVSIPDTTDPLSGNPYDLLVVVEGAALARPVSSPGSGVVVDDSEYGRIYVARAEFSEWLWWKNLYTDYYKTRQNVRGHTISVSVSLTRKQARLIRDRYNIRLGNEVYRLVNIDAYDPLGLSETTLKLEKVV